MRRGRIFIYIGLILILGLVAVAVFIFRPVQQPGPSGDGTIDVVEPEPTPVDNIDVVVLVQSIDQGQRITQDYVDIVQISEDEKIDGMFSTVAEVVDSFARFDLSAGTYLTTENLIFKDFSPSDHAIFIPPGMVAVSIPMDRLGSVAQGIRGGDHVNVIVTLLFTDLDSNFQTKLPNFAASVIAPGPAILTTIDTQGSEQGGGGTATNITVDELLQTLTAQISTGGSLSPIGRLELDESLGQPFYVVPSERELGARPRLVAQTLLQNVIVLQYGDFALEAAVITESTSADGEPTGEPTGEEPAPAEDGSTTTTTTPEAPDTVTLIVTPQDAVTLNYLLQYSDGVRLSLALRSADDGEIILTEAVTLQFLLDQYSIPVPAKLPFGIEPRIDTVIDPELINDQAPPEEQQ